jgi:hypothetical protein
MSSNRFAFAALAVACLAAAAGGGYLANRQNAVPAPAMAQSAPAATAAQPVPDATASTKPVQETEAVVGDTSASTAKPEATKPEAAKPEATKSAARRPDPAPRPAAPADTRASSSSAARRNNQSPAVGTITSTWPSSASANGTQPAAPQPPVPPPAPDASFSRPSDVTERAAEPVHAPEPPKPTFEELVVSADAVIGLQTENRISSETAHIEDRVEAKVTRDVKVGDRVAIPAGSRALGSVTQVDQGGKFKEQARLGIRFHTIVLADGTRLPISTETIMRYGEAPGNSSASKIGGGAVGGAILGAILGGAKGAAIGATAGAGAGTAAVVASGKSAAVLQPGTPVTARILTPVTVTVEK